VLTLLSRSGPLVGGLERLKAEDERAADDEALPPSDERHASSDNPIRY
jgi:hypothetical protein